MPATQNVGDVQSTPDFASWRGANVDALEMGVVERGGTVQSSVRVWDTAAAQQVIGKSYSTDPLSYRRIALIVSDAIYESLAGAKDAAPAEAIPLQPTA